MYYVHISVFISIIVAQTVLVMSLNSRECMNWFNLGQKQKAIHICPIYICIWQWDVLILDPAPNNTIFTFICAYPVHSRCLIETRLSPLM